MDETDRRIAQQNTNTILKRIQHEQDEERKKHIVLKLATLCDYIADNQTITALLGKDMVNIQQKIIKTQHIVTQTQINF